MVTVRLLPGYGMMNETLGGEFLVPGYGILNETISEAPPTYYGAFLMMKMLN